MTERLRQAAAFAALLAACAAPPAAAQEWVPRQNAELQVLDKVTARVSVLRANVGQAARYGTLTIAVCAPATPGRRTRCPTPPPSWR